MRISDWSSDVCSSDLVDVLLAGLAEFGQCLVALADDFLHRLHLREAHVVGARAVAETDVAAKADHQLRDEEGDDGQGHEQPHRADVAHAAACEVLAGERSEEHTSELQSLMRISYAVSCLTKKKNKIIRRCTSVN